MIDINFADIQAAIRTPRHSPAAAANPARELILPSEPRPFVAPTLRQFGSSLNLAVEVLFIQAPAAVGKTTLARYLAASKKLPYLDLAKVPVSTGSLKALVSNLTGGPHPLPAFHRGDLAIVIDALDEGRLLSGETGFESFITTAAEFILSNRSATDRPKLVIFGRPESTDLAKVAMELESEGGITSDLLEVAFFDQEGARALIHEYAKSSAGADSRYNLHPGPADDVVTAYFAAIEAALSLPLGNLWKSERGLAFAGYAPVLRAVGSLLAAMDNFPKVEARLRSAGAQEAWDVVDQVISVILDRERDKLCALLRDRVSSPLPAETYDDIEQLVLLTAYVHGQPLAGKGHVVLPPADRAKYDTMVRQYIEEHPFVRQGEFRDPVLAAVVLSTAVAGDLLQGLDLKRLSDASRQPFLWRSLHRRIAGGFLIDGRYLGAILGSFWNDPLTKRPRVVIRSPDQGFADVRIPSYCDREITFQSSLPVTLDGQARDCDLDVAGGVRLQGQTLQSSGSVFHVNGTTALICDSMEISADTITMHGNVWFEAQAVTAPNRLEVRVKNGTQVGWGGALPRLYPWSQHPSTLSPPYGGNGGDVMRLVKECSERLRSGFTLMADCSIPEDDAYIRWAARSFGDVFPRFVRVLIARDLAWTEQISASGAAPKIRVHLKAGWDQIRDLLQSGSAEGEALRSALGSGGH